MGMTESLINRKKMLELEGRRRSLIAEQKNRSNAISGKPDIVEETHDAAAKGITAYE